MIVRRAGPADRPIWAAMLGRLHGPDTTSGQFQAEMGEWEKLDEPLVCWLAFDADGTAVGMVDARVRNYAEGAPNGPAAYIEDLWVEEDWRRRGVAAALVEAVEDWAVARNLPWLGSDAELANADSHALHRALGFEEVERLVVFGKPLGS